MSSSEGSYYSEPFDELQGSSVDPVIRKKCRLIAAVEHNQVDVLRDLLDSPQWYNVTNDHSGYSLLQIAIIRENKEVFDYMMSIPDFPIEFANEIGQTALVVSLCSFFDNCDTNEHFAYELLKKGASIDIACFDKYPPLHYALKRSYIKVTQLLIEAGVDVNVPNDDGETALNVALRSDDKSEAVTALLMYGAEPSFDLFTTSVMNDDPFLVQESLFLYLCDEYSDVEIDLDVLLELAIRKSPLFHEIMKLSVGVEILKDKLNLYFQDLCSMSVNYLKIVIENFGLYISESFSERSLGFYRYDRVISITNLNVMVESNMRPNVITLISTLDGRSLFESLIDLGCSKSTIEELYFFLLSYGLTCKEFDLQIVYKNFGYCKLFKFLLHTDFHSFNLDLAMRRRSPPFSDAINVELEDENVMATFIYDVNMNLEKFLSSSLFVYRRREDIELLLSYFAHPKLREAYYEMVDDQTTQVRENLPRMPRLEELARNAYRTFFIEKFQITTSRKFYSLLNYLPISPVHKKIITYETKLY